jgi:predicted acylesterase/phospholipase RssA
MSVVDAVYASMAVPVLLAPVTAHLTPHAPLTRPDVLVDGGIFDNYPIQRFAPHEVIGFRFDWGLPPLARDEMATVYGALYRTIMACTLAVTQREWESLPRAYKRRTITIDVGTAPLVDASGDGRLRAQFIQAGYDAVRLHLERQAAAAAATRAQVPQGQGH